MGRPEKLENWLIEAAEVMAREGVTLREAAGMLNQDVTADECDVIVRRKSFHRLLWESRLRYFNQLAVDPNFKKDTIIGKLVTLAQRLEDRGDYDKAAEAILKAAKVAGFVGPESTVSVFGELSQADLDSIRRKVEEGAIGVKSRPN